MSEPLNIEAMLKEAKLPVWRSMEDRERFEHDSFVHGKAYRKLGEDGLWRHIPVWEVEI